MAKPIPLMPAESAALLSKTPLIRPGLRVLLIGPETEEEFQYAWRVNRGGGKATAVNPVRTPAAASFKAKGGDFVDGTVESLPQEAVFDLIREDFPYPTGNYVDVPMVKARLSRLRLGGSWVVVTEKEDFATTLSQVTKVLGAKVILQEIAATHESVPVSKHIHPREARRFALVIKRQ